MIMIAMSTVYFLVAVVLAFVCYIDFIYPILLYPWIAYRRKGSRVPRTPNRPLGIPDTWRKLKLIRQNTLLQHLANVELVKSARTDLRQVLGKWVIETRDPDNIKAVLSTQFNDFSLIGRNKRIQPVIGSGIFTQDGDEWKHSRLMLKPQFTKDQISRLEHITDYVDILIDRIHHAGNEVELQDCFHLMTMDTATQFLFGESVNSLKINDYYKGTSVIDPVSGEHVFAKDFVESYRWLNEFALQKLILNDLAWVAPLVYREHRMHLSRAHAYMDHYVNLALKATEHYVAGAEEMKSDYIFSHELAKESRDPIVLRDQMFNILIAGRDTTASTLSFAFHFFVNNPDVWQKIRDEVWSIFPNGDLKYVTYEDLRKPKYLQMVIKEVLRLQPAVPLNGRTAVRDTYLPRGGGPKGDESVFVPKGTSVKYSTYLLHRDPAIYGPDANEFRPERWVPGEKYNSHMSAWGYIPFNGGPRICLGQQFALTEISVTIMKLALAFKSVEPGEGFAPELSDKVTLTVMVGGTGVPVKFTS